ncbi:SR-related and CTD-associated factor 4 isoform X2 [Scaptodrosophila lebanonensis]|uniref:SR-related and CTD-associated factor 4 isoform X2 n=1 Tax=Drosophila lebanonensis TaxID=7225 RepID=A0A6J2TF61_DROLE|nr:SR-related and CTD-associated factor 4 isoform X2 [Scaptodrosophila lebanonensis]
MDTVVAFNNELSGLYDSRPPISKAKMAAITKSAMRAIKFYKHVVQSVEKFILKCKPEYKVPGLYVIDSIVRQSRHQYGTEKDVFAPRFQRNLTETFANLFRCAPEDKSRIIRVLNLWQKNNVFKSDVIQPIFDLADPNHPIYHQMPPVGGMGGVSGGVGAGPSSSGALTLADISSGANGLNTSGLSSLELSMSSGMGGPHGGDDKLGGMPDLSNNNLKQLLNDPNVLRQLQTLQSFQKFKQQEENQKLRYQDDSLQQHLHNVLKGTAGIPPGMGMGMSMNDVSDMNKDVEFVSEQQNIEVINLDGGDSRSPTPDRERYKRGRRSSRSRSRSPRDGRGSGRGGGTVGPNDRSSRRRSSRSRSRSRSPRGSRRRNSRDRERMERSARDKERDREHERERRKKGLPEIKKEHLSVCSTTLWVGHLSKLVYQEELSDTFGEYGDIVSIDQIVPRGCAFIVMNRRQDAHKAMQGLKNHKLQGRAITISWAAGKGVKSKEWKDFWDLELGVTYIPWNKLNVDTDFDSLEEGGMFDEDTMPGWMKDKINQVKNVKDNKTNPAAGPAELPKPLPPGPPNLIFGIDTTQPPPVAQPLGAPGAPPPTLMGMVPPGQFSMAPPIGAPPPRMMGPMGPIPSMGGMPMPPNMMMMPPSMMPPGFAGLPGGPPHPLSLPPPGAQFPPPGAVPPPMSNPPPPNVAACGNVSSDDQMDIEMEVEETPQSAPPPPQQQPPNFNQPPPIFSGSGAPANSVEAVVAAAANEMFQRERGRGGGGGSRWGGRDDVNDGPWRGENGGGPPPVGGGGAAFNEARARLNLNHMELGIQQQQPQRSDFMDFDNRPGGPRGMGPRPGNLNGGADFLQPNMNQNRFNQPTSLMQMRIPPPMAFNQRMGGPNGGGNGGVGPMFMRNQGGGGNGPGGRQQGPGFFNPRNPFNDNQRVRGGGRNIGSRGGGGGGGRWSDDEDDGNNFKRRGGPGGGGGSRFRDRDNGEDRRGGNMRGRGGPRDERERGGNRRSSRDDSNRHSFSSTDENSKPSPAAPAPTTSMSVPSPLPVATNTTTAVSGDTEEDWDRELQEYDARMEAEKMSKNDSTSAVVNESAVDEAAATSQTRDSAPTFVKPQVEDSVEEVTTKPLPSPACTPLYDELPPPAAAPPKMDTNRAPTPETVNEAPPTNTTQAVTETTAPSTTDTEPVMESQPVSSEGNMEPTEAAG